MRAPLRHPALQLALLVFVAATLRAPAQAATGWIPPLSVTALLPSATFAPGSAHSIELTLRANGVPADLNWVASAGGAFTLGVTPSGGSVTVPADSVRRVTISITVPPAAVGAASLSLEITNQIGGGHVMKASATFFSASGGRPEIWPNPATWSAPANTAGSVSFQVHSLLGTAESLVVTDGRLNPDPNNAGALFGGGTFPTDVNLPGGATITLSEPTTIAGSAYAGNANTVQCSITSNEGISSALGYALVSAALPDSLPTALDPVGLTPIEEPAAGRDGPVEMASRGLWLLPAGLDGVRVLSAGSQLARIGPVDTDGNGSDDRLVGQVRIPSYAASIAVIPGFIGPSGDTLDLGLLAAGRAGLMLLDLRNILDPPFGTWSDFFDQDMNGIDDRILRTIPTPGFATDVTWFRAPTGRIVALVADADTGSVPVAVDYDPSLVSAGTGAGVVAVDVTAAFDSLGGVPYAAGTLPTPGSAIDLELRRAGAGAPDLAIADGAAGVSLYHLTAGGSAPATITFTPLGSVALSSAWGTPYARDACWISNTRDSVYLAVAASAGGVQIVRAPLVGTPSLMLAQQTSAPAIGLAGTWTGTLAAALGAGGVVLMRSPSGSELDKIAPAAGPPYTAPVTLARGQLWTEGRALEVAWQWTPSASSTSMAFQATAGPIPDLLVSDGSRALLLRPGQATIVAVGEERSPPRAVPLVVSVAPNPISERTDVSVFDGSSGLRSGGIEIRIFDVQGRVVRTLRAASDRAAPGAPASLLRLTWDGRDDRGRRLGSGRYWLRARSGARETTRAVLILR
jgi:hypothetical protein